MAGSPLSPSIREAHITPLKKKGNSAYGLVYRPIMLLNADYKIVTGVITARLGRVGALKLKLGFAIMPFLWVALRPSERHRYHCSKFSL